MTKPSESGFDFYGVTNEEEVFATLTRAADLGITFWDTADLYGTSTSFPSFFYYCTIHNPTLKHQANKSSENGSPKPAVAPPYSSPPNPVPKTSHLVSLPPTFASQVNPPTCVGGSKSR